MATKAELLELLDRHDPDHGLTMDNTKAELEDALATVEADHIGDEPPPGQPDGTPPTPDVPSGWATHRPPGARASGSGMWH